MYTTSIFPGYPCHLCEHLISHLIQSIVSVSLSVQGRVGEVSMQRQPHGPVQTCALGNPLALAPYPHGGPRPALHFLCIQ